VIEVDFKFFVEEGDSMPATYDRVGLRFLYPDNWKLMEADHDSQPETVSLQSPGGGFWSLMVYRGRLDALELTRKLVEAMSVEYEALESSACEERLGAYDAEGFDMGFHCLDFLVAARTLAIRHDNDVLLLLWQAEDREFDTLLPVFRAMTTSLLNSLADTVSQAEVE